jgi:regulator of sigma E protease
MGVFLVILGLVLFVALVVVHEFGHLLAARRNKVEVEEFGIGFPPIAWKKKLKSGLLFTINWLPLGGFVRLKGEHDADTEKGSYGAASLWAKTQIMVAGVLVNLSVAILMFTLLALIGMPKLVDNQFTVPSDTTITKNEVLVGAIEDDSPASKAGLQQRDQLISIGTSLDNAQQISSAESLPKVTSVFAGQEVQITYERAGNTATAITTLRTTEEVEKSKNTDDPKGYLGIVPAEYTLQRSTWSAPIVGVAVTKQFTELTFKGLGTVISSLFQGDTKKASDQVSGPVGVFVLIKDGSELGIQFVLMVIAVISLTLAIMNALPIPALDGGRLFVTYLYRVLGKKLTPKAEELIHGIGFAALMVLFVLITVVDVKRFF